MATDTRVTARWDKHHGAATRGDGEQSADRSVSRPSPTRMYSPCGEAGSGKLAFQAKGRGNDASNTVHHRLPTASFAGAFHTVYRTHTA